MSRWIHIIGLALLAIMVFRMDWSVMGTTWKQLAPERLGIGLTVGAIAFIALLGLRVYRFGCLLRPRRPIPQRDVLAATVRAGFLGMVTPGRLGDLTRTWMLRRCGVDPSEAFAIWIFERGLDVASLISLGLAALFVLFLIKVATCWILPLYLIILLVGVSIGLPIGRYLVRWGLLHVHRLPASIARHAHLGTRLDDILRWNAPAIFSTAIMQWCGCLGFIAILVAVVPSASPVGASASYAASSALAILPISIGGLGMREAGNVGVLAQFSIPHEQALFVSLVDGFVLPVLIFLFLMPLVRLPRLQPELPKPCP